MQLDFVDKFTAEWAKEDPKLDLSAVSIIGRILRISTHLERDLETLLKRFDLKPGQFQVLAALRRHLPRALTPTEITQAVFLTSGAMTPLLDKLEATGFVRRIDHPTDRRGVLVELTDQGRETIDRVISARVARANEVFSAYDPAEMEEMTGSLRKLLIRLEGPVEIG